MKVGDPLEWQGETGEVTETAADFVRVRLPNGVVRIDRRHLEAAGEPAAPAKRSPRKSKADPEPAA